MNKKYLERLLPQFKEEGILKLNKAHVLLFGLGGVGSYTLEALIRGGIENITIVDGDYYQESNINRQLYATTKTIGKLKTEVAKERVLEINPEANVNIISEFYPCNTEINFSNYTYIIDAIDDVKAKIEIINLATSLNINIISCMGTGGKLDPTKLQISDISKTNTCPLARVMRKKLGEIGIKHLKVLFSTEEPLNTITLETNKHVPSSNSFVPPVAGLIIAGEVIKEISK